ncbi:hypothetical protein HH310_30110 [Actinoplanes sp. TBRC 11911]|uniref:hypothetical protein n=1 Tax=Actinoplanes sp. TBRC 11911 TaxID=2729386 RepID=UPI00145C826F|nr:hypothetical protein [Actinoplanes sp. TBRC 11911]NMO55424.1 hypothetical protein [Actinoplanes sp. TBRC 11911]
MLRLSALLSCGTRSVLDAVFAPLGTSELDQARQLAPACTRECCYWPTVTTPPPNCSTATGADVLIRCKANRKLPLIARHRDRSWQSALAGRTIRVIEARIAVTTSNGIHTIDHRGDRAAARIRRQCRAFRS